jgi:hypothetical protein
MLLQVKWKHGHICTAQWQCYFFSILSTSFGQHGASGRTVRASLHPNLDVWDSRECSFFSVFVMKIHRLQGWRPPITTKFYVTLLYNSNATCFSLSIKSHHQKLQLPNTSHLVNYIKPSFMSVYTSEVSTLHFSYDTPNSLKVFWAHTDSTKSNKKKGLELNNWKLKLMSSSSGWKQKFCNTYLFGLVGDPCNFTIIWTMFWIRIFLYVMPFLVLFLFNDHVS